MVVGLGELGPNMLVRRRSSPGEAGTFDRLSIVLSERDGLGRSFRTGEMSPAAEGPVDADPSSEPSLLMFLVCSMSCAEPRRLA